ncbi:hypothetical protein [Sandaracinus amylolyticus]|uniref:Uncharacterized protein n=1 Tax=Sandaracinus amylolyticus TaxID=927083 RepID=A0A0F6VYS8_9BACT|nr:hypothetical protein [Sandaracinus amylolyticus]AKF03061.1 hypothetical protein DB32_000210 [Sandaracinus amylolyticus]
MTLKVLFTIAVIAFLLGPQIVALVRNVRDAVRARVRVGQQTIVYREDRVRLRYTSLAWWSLALGWQTVDVVIGKRDAFLFARPLFGIVPRPVYRLVRDADPRGKDVPGIVLAVTSVGVEKGRVAIRAHGWRGIEKIVVRLSSRSPDALARALR